MTSTNIFNGLDVERSSSKVIAPPGGASSLNSILGHCDMDAVEHVRTPRRSTSSVEDMDVVKNGIPATSCKAKLATQRSTKDSVFGDTTPPRNGNASNGARYSNGNSPTSVSRSNSNDEAIRSAEPARSCKQKMTVGQSTKSNVFGRCEDSPMVTEAMRLNDGASPRSEKAPPTPSWDTPTRPYTRPPPGGYSNNIFG